MNHVQKNSGWIGFDNKALQVYQKQKPSWTRKVMNVTQEFCKNTSLHGFRYLVEENRSCTERICWLSAIMLSVIACGWLLADINCKWKESPIIITFVPESKHVSSVMFPALTICSEVKVTKDNFEDIINSYKGEGKEDLRTNHEDLIKLICPNDYSNTGNRTVNREAGLHFLKKIAPGVSDVLSDCTFKGVSVPCKDIFMPYMTDEGMCFTFNGVPKNILYKGEVQLRADNKEELAASKNETRRYLMISSSAGPKSGLSAKLFFNDKFYSRYCQMPFYGFKAIFHDPFEYPVIRNRFFRIPTSQVLMVALKPNIIKTQQKLQKYSPEKRQCYFLKENQLRYFKDYSQENCEIECLTNFTIELCGCAAFYMPSNDSVPMCSSGSSECVSNTSDLVYHQGWTISKCRCLSRCQDTSFDVELSQAKFEFRNFMVEDRPLGSSVYPSTTSDLTQIFVYFRDTHYLQKERREIYGNTDFLASCGGLLGLFLGFSVISLVEPVYYMTLRIFGNKKIKQGQK